VGQKLGLGGSLILKNKEEPKVINKIEYLPNMVGDHLTMDGIVNPCVGGRIGSPYPLQKGYISPGKNSFMNRTNLERLNLVG